MKRDKLLKEPVIQHVLEMALKQLSPKKVLLFGSRARGDMAERSDYDFAFYLHDMNHENWAKFSLEIIETAPTLCKIDLVLVSDNLRQDFKDRIQSEGIVLYEDT